MEKHPLKSVLCSEAGFKSNIFLSGHFVLHLSGNFIQKTKSFQFARRGKHRYPGLRDMAMSAQCLRSMQINLAPEEGRSNAASAMGIRSPCESEPNITLGTPICGLETPQMPQMDTPSGSFTAFQRERESGAFVPVECPLSCKVPSPVEQMVREQRQKLLSMQLERAEYEVFKLRRQITKMTEHSEAQTARVRMLQSNLSVSRARESSSAASVMELEGKLAVAEQARDALKAEIAMLQRLLLQADGNAERARNRGLASLAFRRNACQKRLVLRILGVRLASSRALRAAGSRMQMFARRHSLTESMSAWINFAHDMLVAKQFPLGGEAAGGPDGCDGKTHAAPSPCMSVTRLAMSCGLAWDNHGKLSFAPRALGAPPLSQPPSKPLPSSGSACSAVKPFAGALGGRGAGGEGNGGEGKDRAASIALLAVPSHAAACQAAAAAAAAAASAEDATQGICDGGKEDSLADAGEKRKALGVINGNAAHAAGQGLTGMPRRHTKFQPSFCSKPTSKVLAKPGQHAAKGKQQGGRTRAAQQEVVGMVSGSCCHRPHTAACQVSPLRLAEAVLKVRACVLECRCMRARAAETGMMTRACKHQEQSPCRPLEGENDPDLMPRPPSAPGARLAPRILPVLQAHHHSGSVGTGHRVSRR